ncbi:tyrosine-protein phosphatase [Halalkalibacterium ligniniphilum]|uniref:tyrosine-protein phosphatase n=1 Tax=Halalkalibacterium ligniniphilum TaxID=1134413 RepID=UPI0003472D8E|nr:CpsB/CapC family capsule biosynthesis tyrosine phosphatase [Halalkalibacterium ligniniphilum]
MIDIHSHILWGMDDGPERLEDAVVMAKQAQEQGIYAMIATPHYKNGHYENKKKEIKKAVEKFNHELRLQKLDVNIVPGQEVRLHRHLLDDYRKGDILTLNEGRYLLVECPSGRVPTYTNKILYELQVAGIIPVLAHPERNQEFIEHPNKLFEVVNRGVLTQVTASSLTGRFGKKVKRFAEQLIENRLTHFIASDTHNIGSRPNELRLAFETIANTFDQNTVYLLQENAESLIYGEEVYADPPNQIKQKKFLGIF